MNHRFSWKSIFDPLDPTALIYHFESCHLSQNAQHLGGDINWI